MAPFGLEGNMERLADGGIEMVATEALPDMSQHMLEEKGFTIITSEEPKLRRDRSTWTHGNHCTCYRSLHCNPLVARVYLRTDA